jgi:hypothetical protein
MEIKNEQNNWAMLIFLPSAALGLCYLKKSPTYSLPKLWNNLAVSNSNKIE